MKNWPRYTNSLDERSCRIASAWCEVINSSTFVPKDSKELLRELTSVAQRATGLLWGAQFDPQAANGVGRTLGRLCAAQPELLGQMQAVFAEQITLDLLPAEVAGLHPRLCMLLCELGTGFAQEVRQTMLTEQEQIREGVLMAKEEFESRLRESEARFRLLTEATFEGIVIHDQGVILDANPALASMFGYELSELIGMFALDLAAPDSRDVVERNIRCAFQAPYEAVALKKDGTRLDVDLIGRYFPYQGRTVRVAAVRDITARKQAQAKLAEVRRRLATIREEQQVRLAQELHDGALQELLGISYQLLELEEQLFSPSQIESTKKIWRDVLDVAALLRAEIGQLRPPGLDKGLAVALQAYVNCLREQKKMPHIHLELTTKGDKLQESVALSLFRIAQEALRNARRHANAQKITIGLHECRDTRSTSSGRSLTLDVSDDGCGFLLPKCNQLTEGKHFGVVGMMERAQSIGAQLKICSQPGEGTAVMVRLPLNNGD